MTDDSIFAAALAIGSPSERAAFLNRVCTNPVLRKEIDELLAAHAASNVLDRPPADLARTGAFESEGDGPAVAVGDRVGPYKLLERIGEGGMGEVWVADQLEPIKRRVALKLIKPGMDSRAVLARFEAERQALAVMDHPNIAKVLDAGTTPDGRPFFVMELVKGTPITEFCDARKLSSRERLERFIPVCQAIQHAHMKGIIHRDIKPSNVLVALHDEVPVPKVIDFGVAKAIGQQLTEKTIYTGFGALIGTPAYMAPEQATFNQLDVDTRADVYALGVLLYELLTGSPPVEPERLKKAALDEVLRIVRDEEPPRPSQRLSTSQAKATIAAVRQSDPAKLSNLLRGEVDWIVMKALEKDRTRRYDTATALAKDVQRYLAGDAVEARPQTWGYRLRKAYGRNRAGVWIAGAFSVLLVSGIVTGAVFAVQATRAEERARLHAEIAEVNAATADDLAKVANAEREEQARQRKRADDGAYTQSLIRYAAEMNLLQAAYNAKDIVQVKKLLDAQVPKSGEADLRGPEWHYWNRKFQSHEKELSVPCPPPTYRLGLHSDHVCGLAPDGNTFVVVVCGKNGGLKLQVWDYAARSRLKEIEVLPDTSPDKLTCSHDIHCSRDSQKVLIERCVTNTDEPDLKYSDQFWLVDLRTNDHKLVDEKKRRAERNETEFISDDLEHAIDREVDVALRSTTVIVRTMAVRQEIGRVTVPGLAHAWLAPDRQHILIVSFLEDAAFGRDAERLPPRRKATLSCWKLGEARPVWQQEDMDYAYSPSRLTLNGGEFLRLVAEDNSWVLKRCELATGRTIGTTPVVPIAEAGYSDRSDVPPRWALSADGRRIAFQTWNGVGVCDLGVKARASTFGESRTTHYEFETFESSAVTQRLTFLPDGRVALMWDPFDFRLTNRNVRGERAWDPDGVDRLLLRTWRVPPFGSGNDRSKNTVASPDGRRIAICLRKLAGDGSKLADRIVVIGADGRRVFETDLGEVVTDISRETPHLGFSPDGRYLYLSGRSSVSGTYLKSPQAFIAWDLEERREVTRVAPDPGTQFFDAFYRDMRFDSRDGGRILLQIAKTDAPSERTFGGPKLAGGKLVEFLTGKTVCTFTIPDHLDIRTLQLEDEAITGHSLSNTFIDSGTVIPIHQWDRKTGAYRGPSQLKLPQDWPATSTLASPVDRWVQNGNRAIHQQGNRVEVWDAAHRDKTDKPIFTHDLIDAQYSLDRCELSPDGTRLTVTKRLNRFRTQVVLLCTSTGREVFCADWPPGFSTRFGCWSPDGGEYWSAVNGDGKLIGWDFRPVSEVKRP